MFRLFEVFQSDVAREVMSRDNLYTVHELGRYYFEYTSSIISSELIFVEDVPINEQYIEDKTGQRIKTRVNQYFEDYFGFAKLSINNEEFQFNILCEKLELNEVKEMFLFLYDKNHFILNDFISKSSIGGATIYKGKEYFYSSKYLNLLNNFCEIFEQLYGNFRTVPHTVIRKSYKLSDYSNQVIDSKSIEWILQNLDSINFDFTNRNHPDSVNVLNSYGLIEKIGAEENEISFDTYENAIILGGFKFLKEQIFGIKRIIQAKLKRTDQTESLLYQQYIDFRDLKEIPFLKLLKDLDDVEGRLFKISLRYKRLFLDVQVKNTFPKLTPVFNKYRHYQKAYNAIKLIRTAEYDLNNELQLLNVRKLSELYELFNLNILIQVLNGYLNDEQYDKTIRYTSDNESIFSINYRNRINSTEVVLYFNAPINNTSSEIGLITIGNLKLAANYCRPDFIIKIVGSKLPIFCILDSKYSKFSTVRYRHMPECVNKYIMDIGVECNPFRKPDYLILLYPDKNANTHNLVYNNRFFPKMSMVVSKPSSIHPLESFIQDVLSTELTST